LSSPVRCPAARESAYRRRSSPLSFLVLLFASSSASLLYRFVSGSGLAYIYGFVLRSRGVSDPTVVRPSMETARSGVDWGFDGGVGFSGLVSRSCFPFQISLCWSWCSRFGVEVSPLLRLVVIRGSVEVVIGLAWWFSRSVAASWRLGLTKRTQVSSSEFLGGESRTAVCSRCLWLVDVFLGDPSSFGSPYLVFVLGLLGCGDGLILWRFWSHWFLCSRLPLLTLEVGSFMSLSIVLWFSKATASVTSSVSLLASVSRLARDISQMGQDYSYSQPSSSDEYDITALIQAEVELYGDEAESNYHIAEPLQYLPQPECDEGIPTTCYCGGDPVVSISSTAKDPGRRYFTCPNVDDGDCHIWKWLDVAITEEMRELQTQIKQLKDQGFECEQKVVKLQKTMCALSKKKPGLITNGFAMEEELQRSKSECLKPQECPYNKCAYLRICIAVRVTYYTSLTMDKNTSYVNLMFSQSQSSVDLDSPEPFWFGSQVKEKLSKHKLLERLLGKKEPLTEMETSLKLKLMSEMLGSFVTRLVSLSRVVCLLSSRTCEGTDPPMKLPRTTTTMGELFWGYFFVIIGSVSFFGFVFAVIASTLLPLFQKGLKNDRYYYCFLVPLTIPVITVAVYFHWLSIKLFKHA
ncbi:hypothetical protein IGI04_006350, partial [Brassica rapa subsp. trilocularis]